MKVVSLILCVLYLSYVIRSQYTNTYQLKEPNSTSSSTTVAENFGTSVSISVSTNPLLAVGSSNGYVYIYSLAPITPTHADYINYTLISGYTTYYNINSSTSYYPTLTYVVPPALPSNIFTVSYTGISLTSDEIAISYTNSAFNPYNSSFSTYNNTASVVVVYSHANGTQLYPNPTSSKNFITPPSDDNGNFGGSFPGGLAIYSRWLFIGSPTADSGVGRFYIYHNDQVSTTSATADAVWTLQSVYRGTDANIQSAFLTGNSIAISEGSGVAIVGCPGANEGAGQVLLFDLNNMQVIVNNNSLNNYGFSSVDPISMALSEFGYAVGVSSSGRFVIVSAPGSDAVFIYQPSITGGSPQGASTATTITLNLIYSMVSPSPYGKGIRFGTAVSVSDAGTAVVGTTNGLAFVYLFDVEANILAPTSLTTPAQVLTLNSVFNVNATATASPVPPSASTSPSTNPSLSPSVNAITTSTAASNTNTATTTNIASTTSTASVAPSSGASSTNTAAATQTSVASATSVASGTMLPSTTPSFSPVAKKRQNSTPSPTPNTFGLTVAAAGGNGIVNDLVVVSAFGDTSSGSSSSLVFPQSGASTTDGTGSVFLYTQCQYDLIGQIQSYNPVCLLSYNDIYIQNSITLQRGQGITLQGNSRLIILGDLTMLNGSYINTTIDSIIVVQGTFSVTQGRLFVGVTNDTYLNNIINQGNGNRFELIQYGILGNGGVSSGLNTWEYINSGFLFGTIFYNLCGAYANNINFTNSVFTVYINRDGHCYEIYRPNGSGQSDRDYIIGAFLGVFGPCIVIALMTIFFYLLVRGLKIIKNFVWPKTDEDVPLVVQPSDEEHEAGEKNEETNGGEGSSHSK